MDGGIVSFFFPCPVSPSVIFLCSRCCRSLKSSSSFSFWILKSAQCGTQRRGGLHPTPSPLFPFFLLVRPLLASDIASCTINNHNKHPSEKKENKEKEKQEQKNSSCEKEPAQLYVQQKASNNKTMACRGTPIPGNGDAGERDR